MPKRRVTRAKEGNLPPLVPSFDEPQVGLKDAKDLAALLKANPYLVNQLDSLDETEWVRPPEQLLEEARKYNTYRVGENGNYIN